MPPRSAINDGAGNRPHDSPERQRGWLSLTGRWGVLLLLSGAIGILISLMLICTLWWAGEEYFLWRMVVLNSWTIRTTTIATTMLRTSATAHAGLCTSMLAAVALETSGVGLSKACACAISLLRFSNSGPQSLVLPLFSGSRKLGIILLTILLTVTATLLQFTSTVLLFDIGAGLVRDNAQYKSLAIGFNNFAEQASYGSNYWVTMPSNYYMFAEYRKPAPDYDDRWDTGVSKRAFLPFLSSEERSSVGDISGNLPVLDAQVICIRPSMVDAKLLRDQRQGVSVDNSNSFFLDGYSITPMGSGSAISNWTFPAKATFNCSFPTQNPNNDDPKDLPVGFCQLGLGDGSGGRGFLFFKPTGTEESWIKYYNVTRSPVFRGNGRWLDLVVPSGVDVGMSLTLCYTNLVLDILDANAHSNGVLPEAQLTWNNTQSRYDTREVRKQLETLNYPVGKSKILVLEKPPASPKSNVSINYNWLTKALSIKDKGTVTFCMSCNYSFVAAFKTNRAHTAVFQDILEESSNPALALQSQFTTLFQMGYYDRRVEYDAKSSVLLTPFVKVLLPQRHQGFSAVMAIIGAHFILVVVIVACFIRNVRFSMLDNACLPVAQMYGEGTEGLLESSTMMSDGEVDKKLKSEGSSKAFYQLKSQRQEGESAASARLALAKD